MSFGPESLNPRERRAYAHTMIDGHRRGEVHHRIALRAIDRAAGTKKGQGSHFIPAISRAALAPINVTRFADRFAARAVKYRDEPFKLRALEETSHWYVDAREGLASADMLDVGSWLMIAHANTRRLQRDVVVGMGIAGSALASGIGLNDFSVEMAWGNDKKDPTDRYGYGLHGADVDGKRVWVVDDTATTGDSLVTLIEIVRDRGGIVEEADVLTDRSQGKAAEAVQKLGVNLHALLIFDEASGQVFREACA